MRLYLLLSALLFAQLTVAQSPWTRNKGGLYAQAAWHFIPAYDQLFGEDGADRPIDREISEGTAELYAEYGLNARNTLVVSLPYRFLQSSDFLGNSPGPVTNAGSFNRLGNVALALRHNFVSRRYQLSGTLRLELPTGGYDDATGLRSGYDALTVEPMLNFGRGWGRFYAFGYGGYGFRTNDYSHFLHGGLEGGARLGPVWLVAFSEWIHPLENGGIELPQRNEWTGLYVNDQGWLSIGLKGIWEINRFTGLVASAAGVASARNVPANPGIGLGVYFKWE